MNNLAVNTAGRTPAHVGHDIAQKLIANGYRPVPCVGKRVLINGWSKRDFSECDFEPTSNVGIKTGDGIVLVDIDITDPELSEAVVAEWQRRHKGAPQRTGMAPKTAFLVASDVAKKRIVKLSDPEQKVEVLANGQQFVAYGIHPDTGKPYQWHGLDPLDTFLGTKGALPTVTEAEIDDFLQWVKASYGPEETPKLSEQASVKAGIKIDTGAPIEESCTPDKVAEALTYINPDLPYDEWVRVLMAVHDEFGDSGFDLADQWSATGSKYRAGEVEGKFKSFNPGGGISIATVFELAKQGGANLDELKRKHRPARRKARAEAFKVNPPNISPAALRLASRITQKIMKTLPDLAEEPFVDPLIIRDMIEGAFWSGAKSKLFLLNEAETLIQFGASEAWKFLCKRFGSPIDVDEIIAQWETDATGGEGELGQRDKGEARKAINAATIDPVIDHLKYHNQRDAIAWQVDMFGDRARLELQEDIARIVLTHHPVPMGGAYTPALVADYKAHFPELDSVIEFVVASRFALDRKKSFLWMLADSDWGKGFFLGVLESLGLVVQMSVKEIEAVFEGKPAGKSPSDFKRAMILAVDEFKVVKSELKQLQSEIPLAPKYQLTSRVEVFTKLFLSAENVGSLVGEHGVEDQFANRMSMITGRGSILSRQAYEADRGRYFRSCKTYVAQEINRLVEAYRAEGREGAERRADKFLTEFITRHGLGQHFTRLSESIEEIAGEAVDYFRESAPAYLIKDSSGGCYLPHPGKRLQDYLEERFERAEVATLRRRKDEILRAMSADGRGAASHRAERRNVKAVKLKA